jgi:hypothetical protein
MLADIIKKAAALKASRDAGTTDRATAPAKAAAKSQTVAKKRAPAAAKKPVRKLRSAT